MTSHCVNDWADCPHVYYQFTDYVSTAHLYRCAYMQDQLRSKHCHGHLDEENNWEQHSSVWVCCHLSLSIKLLQRQLIQTSVSRGKHKNPKTFWARSGPGEQTASWLSESTICYLLRYNGRCHQWSQQAGFRLTVGNRSVLVLLNSVMVQWWPILTGTLTDNFAM